MKIQTVFQFIRLPLLITLIFILASIQRLPAQETPQNEEPLYVSITCLKVMDQDFMNLVKEVVIPFQKSLIKKGKSIDWALWKVEYPNGAHCDCDYYMTDIHGKFENIETFVSEKKMFAEAQAVFTPEQLEIYGKRWDAAVEARGSQVYQMIDELVPGPVPAKYVSVNYMTVPEAYIDEYVRMEQEIYKPLHKASMEAGILKDWVLFGRVLPRGSDFSGNFITVDLHGDFTNIAKWVPQGTFQEVHPNLDASVTARKMASTRELKRSELLSFVTSVGQVMAQEKQAAEAERKK